MFFRRMRASETFFHAAGAMRRQPVALLTCLLALAVLAYAVKGLLGL